MENKKQLYSLIEKAIGGDEKAFSELYRLYAKTIIFHTRSFVKDRRDVEDVAQEVVIQMLSSIKSLKSPYAFSSWLHRIIRNVCFNHNNRYARKQEKDDPLFDADVLKDEIPDNNPEDAAESHDARTLLYSQIKRLPEMQRTSIIMYYYDDMSYKEIANTLGIKVSTVSTNIMKAKKKLEDYLKKEDPYGSARKILSGMAIGPAITESLRYSSDLMATPAQIDRFCSLCAERVDACIANPNLMHVGRSAQKSVFGTYLIATVVGLLAIAGVLFVASLPEPAIPQIEISEPEIFVPNAEIIIRNYNENSNSVNPYEVQLVILDGIGTPMGWALTDTSGTTLTSGIGETISGIFSGLSPGEYTIHWVIEDDKKARSVVKRDFYIQELS
jgi:RNA polymerase sigma-70 factor (ECF subfamily)